LTGWAPQRDYNQAARRGVAACPKIRGYYLYSLPINI
jgi:hypothetical protein